MSHSHNIVLVGFMGTGKTTVGRLIAERLSWRFTDTDKLIEARAGRPIPDIFRQEGEPAFRKLEAEVCAEVGAWRHTVIATGGGVWIDPVNREKLSATGFVVCLRAPLEQIEARLEADRSRPMLEGPDRHQRIVELMNTRQAAYATIPHTIDTDGHTPYAVCEKIIALWRMAG
ncbi:MAG: shikimate kinase [Aggregatilineales bacterium]